MAPAELEHGEGRMWSWYLMGTVCVWEDKKVLETDCGDGYRTLGMYLQPLNSALKNG